MRILRSNLTAGLADQAMVSLGNFALSVSLARALPITEYGIYSVTLSFLLFFNTLHQAFVIYPLSVRVVSAPATEHAHLLQTAMLLSALGAIVLVPVLGAALLSMNRFMLLPIAFLALLGWQIQEVFRRDFLARNRAGPAILLDAARYLGPLALVLSAGSGIKIASVFLCIAAMSAIAIAPLQPGLWRGSVVSLTGMRRELVHHWRMAGPVVGANLLFSLATQWFLWVLAWSGGADRSATLMALANVVAIISPVMVGTEMILVPEIAGLRAERRSAELLRHFSLRALACGALVMPPLVLIAVFPEQALRLFYGHDAAYAQHPDALRLLAVTYGCYFLGTLFGAFLRGYGKVASVFWMQLYPTLIAMTLGTYLTLRFGLIGACTATLLAGLLRACLGALFAARIRTMTATSSGALA
ncbi:MAG TPA: hypothetical protein VHZ32_00315 [Rhizomicrobium sp.]|nr:hypothetical protein [Rhizomicrobium sp.]